MAPSCTPMSPRNRATLAMRAISKKIVRSHWARGGAHHLLTVEAGHDAQGAVGGRVLGAEVEGHALGLELDVDAGVGGLARDVGGLLPVGGGGHSAASAPSASPSGSPGMGSTSTSPGHGLTSRASRGKSLRRG